MEELIKRLERVIATGAPDKDGLHPISAETVLEVVKQLSEHGTNLAEVGTDCISRRSAIDALDKCHCGGKDENGRPWIYKENAVEAIEMVEPSPSAEPKRGKWVYKGKNGDWQWRADGRGSCWDEWQCDQCKGVETKMSNFCPNCGAKMEVNHE